MQVPFLDELPLHDSEADAGVRLLKEVRKELLLCPRVVRSTTCSYNTFFSSVMKLLKPSLTREFNQYVPFEIGFIVTVIVLVVSKVLHLLSMLVCLKDHLAERLFGYVVKPAYKKISR